VAAVEGCTLRGLIQVRPRGAAPPLPWRRCPKRAVSDAEEDFAKPVSLWPVPRDRFERVQCALSICTGAVCCHRSRIAKLLSAWPCSPHGAVFGCGSPRRVRTACGET
jgi:hypothetical protein